MKRWHIAVAFIAGCSLSALGGYWLGFRDAWPLGVAADFLPRGVVASQQLEMLRLGKTNTVTKILEADVDSALIFGHDVVSHPLRGLWKPLWGLDVYPNYEQYATRLADYRKTHPSQIRPDTFDRVPSDRPDLRETYKELAEGVRQDTAKRDKMIERYATKR